MKIFLLIGVLLFSINWAFGCSFIGYPDVPVNYIAAKTGKIFIGKVISKSWTIQTEGEDKYRLHRIKFKVIKALKGVDGDIQQITIQEALTNLTSCHVKPPKFKTGQKWIIHENVAEDTGVWRILYTSPSFRKYREYDLKEEAQYVENLENAIKNPLTAIYGQYQTFQSAGSIADVEVTIENNKLKSSTRTGKRGEYAFENLPAGNYKIKLPAPFETGDYYNRVVAFLDKETQTYFFEYIVTLNPGDSNFIYTVINGWEQKAKQPN